MTDHINSSNFSPSPLTTTPFTEDDKFHDECGVFGVFDTPEASTHTVLGLHSLQHRGQEAAGIVSYYDG
ncbi:MAG: amidophosphoribosyltransferase, partial [Kordiimonadaceae bacterium]|nr:amidophosphoribosyltransferase [Kordiimonadaceae bacterium]